jgi:DNA polymerase-3 subunit alpha
VDDLKKWFGVDNVFVELVSDNLPSKDIILNDLVSAARHFGLQVVATANAHYLDVDDAEAHSVLVSIKNDIKMDDIRDKRQNFRAHLFSDDEMREYYSEWPEALENTLKIAERCNVELEFGKYYLPNFELEGEDTPEQALISLSERGLQKRLDVIAKRRGLQTADEAMISDYRARLKYELEVIINMGFSGYFLIVQDFINWAKGQDIPVGPGRGSGAGSLVAYSLNITDLDPIEHNLIFERFLNPDQTLT